jgi:spore coat protein H
MRKTTWPLALVAVSFGQFACSTEDNAPPDTASAGSGAAGPYVEPFEPIDLGELPSDVPTVMLEVAPADMALLDQDPYHSDDVLGAFVDGSQIRYENVDVNYRGAYALQSLMDSMQRNWKVKFSSVQMYRDRREWNFNYERHLRQKLTYDLMKFAGVKVPSARHVILFVNGVEHGLYLEYEDPDSRDWVEDKFGDDTGDLYKAAYDIPGEPRYFATMEYLGDLSEDYFFHYRKKRNITGAEATDYSQLIDFLRALNSTPDSQFPAWLEANFDVPRFISYLVVSNFVSNWDGYPHRPKNFWLYHIPAANRWAFIPWDLDATFQTETWALNPMGTEASIFYQFDGYEPYGGHDEEGTERPLATRMMLHAQFRDAYVARYREVLTTFLDRDYLLGRVDALTELVRPYAPAGDMADFDDANVDVREFIQLRSEIVSAQLGQQP